MKSSKVVLIISLIVGGILLFYFVKNENREVYRSYNSTSGKLETFDPESLNGGSGLLRMSEERMKDLKKEERERLLLISIGFFLFLMVGFILTKNNENRNDPIKNLNSLKQKSILSQDEFNSKIKESQKIEIQNKQRAIREAEKKKLIRKLQNLKDKGLLTEQEFDDKLKKIEENII
jgi:hypothetical protein